MNERASALDGLETEGRLAAAHDLDMMSTSDQVELIIAENISALHSLLLAKDSLTQAVELINERVRAGGRLLYFGAGTPGRLGVVDASEVQPTFSVAGRVIGVMAGGFESMWNPVEGNEDNEQLGREDVAAWEVTEHDVVVGVSASGRTPYCLTALIAASELGAKTIAVVNNAGSPIGEQADIVVEVLTGPEVVAGSTRMKAGTTQKVVLNVMSTLSMVALGCTFGDLMVNVRTGNEKLERRAHRIVVEATGVSDKAAALALERSGHDPRVSVVMLLAGCTPAEARRRLESTRGGVRMALDEHEALGPLRVAPEE